VKTFMKTAWCLATLALWLATPAQAKDTQGDLFRGFDFDDPNFAQALDILADPRFVDISSQCNGRLTLTSGFPINANDVNGASILYYAPYSGSKTAIYNGSRWVLFDHGEISLSLSMAANKNYDVFIYSNTGTPTLELSAAWTDDTTRADALTLVNGVRVKSSNNTRRYLGTIRSISVNTTADALRLRFVWNECNQLQREVKIYNPGFDNDFDTNFGYYNGDSNFSVEVVVGISSAYTVRSNNCMVSNGVVPNYMGIGIDSSTVATAKYERNDSVFSCYPSAVAGSFTQGYHYLMVGVSTELSGLAYFLTPNIDGWIFN
jgi:hypothetical protein